MEYIYEIENFMNATKCENIIQRFEKSPHKKKGEMLVGVDESFKRSIDLSISRADMIVEWYDVIDTVTDDILKALLKYNEYMSLNNLDVSNVIRNTIIRAAKVAYPQIQRTDPGGFYMWHHDAYNNRMFTYILYLNDVEEGCGGTTDFWCGKSILPKGGKLLLFPSSLTYLHCGKKLEKGVKYILTGFIHMGKPQY
jgi:hypothetical protein